MKIIKYISVLLCLALTFTLLSACQAKSTESNIEVDNRVIVTGMKKAWGAGLKGSDAVIRSEWGIEDDLEEAMIKHNGQEVWFRVILSFTNEVFVNNEYEKSGDDNLAAFWKNFIETELEYAKQIGVMNICATQNKTSDFEGNVYTLEATSDMINTLTARKIVTLSLAPPARVEGYSTKISDTLTDYISKMSDTDILEVAAIMVYDNYNMYAGLQGISHNTLYNNDLYILFSKGLDMTYAECDALLEQTVEDILKRNNILEKRIVSDGLPQIGPDFEKYPNSMTNEYIFEEMSAGFNAVLTKAEILRLAEDEEIKVIYLAPQK